MTPDRDITTILDLWLADGPTQVSDRAFDAAVDRLYRQRQRPAWRLLWRDLHVTAPMKAALVAAAAIVILVAGFAVLGQPTTQLGAPATPSSTPAPTATPTPSASPTPVAIVCEGGAGVECAGPLTAGQHTSSNFQPALTFAVPDGWKNTFDRDRAYTLVPPGGAFAFQVLSQLAIPEQNASCTAEPKAGVGNTVGDWTEFITGHPGLDASEPVPVSVGGFDGVAIAFHVNTSWTATCPRSVGPAVITLTDSGTPPDRVLYVDDQYSTFTILDVDGETVIIKLESAPNADAHALDQERVQPVIDSMTFGSAS